jgi:hypothetical protein
MNPRTRRTALYAIGAIAILASANALAHSYAGLYDWAVHHRLSGWQAKSWPAEIDVFLAIGELALYVAYLDGWPARQRIWPWATALVGLAVSIAGNIGHIQAQASRPVILADRLTAATSPIAAFAGLAIGLLVLKMTRQHADVPARDTTAGLMLAPSTVIADRFPRSGADGPAGARVGPVTDPAGHNDSCPVPDPGLLRDASAIYQDAAARGEQLSQRTLARQLRGHGHRFPNDHLHWIAECIGLAPGKAA